MYIQRQEYGKAVETLRKALEVDKSEPNVYNSLGYVYNLKKNHKEALMWYKKAIEKEPTHLLAHHNMGCCYFDLGDIVMAKQKFRDVLRINPEYENAKKWIEYIETQEKNK